MNGVQEKQEQEKYMKAERWDMTSTLSLQYFWS